MPNPLYFLLEDKINNLSIAYFRFSYENLISHISLQVESRRLKGWILCFGVPEEYKSISTALFYLILRMRISQTQLNSRHNIGHCLFMNVFKMHGTVCNQH